LLIGVLALCLATPFAQAARAQDSPPAPAAADKAEAKNERPAPPPRREREKPKRHAGEERPRLDVPVSFPADI